MQHRSRLLIKTTSSSCALTHERFEASGKVLFDAGLLSFEVVPTHPNVHIHLEVAFGTHDVFHGISHQRLDRFQFLLRNLEDELVVDLDNHFGAEPSPVQFLLNIRHGHLDKVGVRRTLWETFRGDFRCMVLDCWKMLYGAIMGIYRVESKLVLVGGDTS